MKFRGFTKTAVVRIHYGECRVDTPCDDGFVRLGFHVHRGLIQHIFIKLVSGLLDTFPIIVV